MSRRASIALLVMGGALGWLLALLVVALVLGTDAFNAAFPNPWRLLMCLPTVAALVAWWCLP